jgi:predicted MPP superfamily phosphohydrolase
MINFKVISDIHLEFYRGKKYLNLLKNILHAFQNSNNNDFLLLSGDIGRVDTEHHYQQYSHFLENMSRVFKNVIMIPGNHEYYGSFIFETEKKLSDIVKNFKNVNLLNNSVYIKNDICILGTTLWSEGNLQECQRLNDFYQIHDFKNDPSLYSKIHSLNKIWLKETIEKYRDIHKIIVLTHHQPSFRLIDPKYLKFESMNSFFAANVDDLFTIPNIKYWIYGHTHTPFNGKIDTCHVHFICNPYGYPNENPSIEFFSEFNLPSSP